MGLGFEFDLFVAIINACGNFSSLKAMIGKLSNFKMWLFSSHVEVSMDVAKIEILTSKPKDHVGVLVGCKEGSMLDACKLLLHMKSLPLTHSSRGYGTRITML